MAKIPKALSPGEETLALHLRVNKIDFEREVCLIPGRKWRVDFFVTNGSSGLVVEVEGGTWIQGRHNRGSHAEKEFEKYNALAINGFTVLRFTTGMVTNGSAIETILQLVG